MGVSPRRDRCSALSPTAYASRVSVRPCASPAGSPSATWHATPASTATGSRRSRPHFSTTFALGASFWRHNLNVRFAGEGAECSPAGLSLVAGRELVDTHTSIEHAVPHGTSRELYKGVLAGEAKAVFNGKVIVRPDAQKSDAQQTNKNLLLSR